MDKRTTSEHGFGGDTERASKLGAEGGKTQPEEVEYHSVPRSMRCELVQTSFEHVVRVCSALHTTISSVIRPGASFCDCAGLQAF